MHSYKVFFECLQQLCCLGQLVTSSNVFIESYIKHVFVMNFIIEVLKFFEYNFDSLGVESFFRINSIDEKSRWPHILISIFVQFSLAYLNKLSKSCTIFSQLTLQLIVSSNNLYGDNFDSIRVLIFSILSQFIHY